MGPMKSDHYKRIPLYLLFFPLKELQSMLALFVHFHSRTKDLLSLPIITKSKKFAQKEKDEKAKIKIMAQRKEGHHPKCVKQTQ
jgi:hypothetical protein